VSDQADRDFRFGIVECGLALLPHTEPAQAAAA
jgi:hypothetical protein